VRPPGRSGSGQAELDPYREVAVVRGSVAQLAVVVQSPGIDLPGGAPGQVVVAAGAGAYCFYALRQLDLDRVVAVVRVAVAQLPEDVIAPGQDLAGAAPESRI
jgi:hypothetical protein